MSLCGAARLCARRAAAGLGALDTGAAVCTKDVARGASAIVNELELQAQRSGVMLSRETVVDTSLPAHAVPPATS